MFSAVAQSIDEGGSSVQIKGDKAVVELVIGSGQPTPALPVELSLLDPDGVSRASLLQAVQVQPGKRKYKFDLALNAESQNAAGDGIAWWRLQYRVGDARGVVSLSELIGLDFELRAAAFTRIVPGESMRIRVRALDPISKKAVKGVSIATELRLPLDAGSDEDELTLKGTAQTNAKGLATIDFPVPGGQKFDGDPEITIVGRKNGIVRTIEEDLEDDHGLRASALLTTDKPLYQPGQTFNVRALLLDPNNVVMPERDIEFSVEDEDDTVVFRQEVKTSAFGIAAISWPIPDNAKLGAYSVSIEADDDLIGDRLAFRVSRYDLPNFAVTVTPDKPYFLPSDAVANVTVSADYLFGKPVANGKIRIVRESAMRWNNSSQSYDVEEGPAVEGTADAQGKFVAKLDLTKDMAELLAHDWRRFDDLTFTAYYTDLTTNRTEQRRFDLRLTREPIHVYVHRYASEPATMPFMVYVSTFYADGTPAECSVDITGDRTAVRLRTNSLGAGKTEFDIPGNSIRGSRYEVRVRARDRRGNVGTYDESYSIYAEGDVLRVDTDKAIYKPGEVIEVTVHSSRRTDLIYLDIVKNWTTLDSRAAYLNDGKARLTIPYKPSFRGDLVIAAYSDDDEWPDDMRAARGIIFPEQANLFVDAKFLKETYRPGEDASVRFTVRDATRRKVESALGIGIFDRAIEERARADAQLGEGLLGRIFEYLGHNRSFGSVTLKDLNELDLTQPISPEMQLAAEMMLAGNWYRPSIYQSGEPDAEARLTYREAVQAQVKPLADALHVEFEKSYDHAFDESSFARILAIAGIDHARVLDPWGQPFRTRFKINRSQSVVTIFSAGPDKKADTDDDIDGWSRGFNYFTKTGNAVDQATLAYQARTGGHIRNLESLTSELEKLGVPRSELKDPWGRDYRFHFEISGRFLVTRVESSGPEGTFDVWRNVADYFRNREAEINRILHNEVNLRGKPFPRTAGEINDILRHAGLDVSTIKDGYGNAAYFVATTEPHLSDSGPGNRSVVQMTLFKLRSRGADGIVSEDDTDLADFSRAITAARAGKSSAAEYSIRAYSGAKGAITGTVCDQADAVIPNVEVIAVDSSDESKRFSTRSNELGEFLLADIPSGSYSIKVPAAYGFSERNYSDVIVRSRTLTEIKIVMMAASVSGVVDVSSQSVSVVDTASTSLSTNVTRSGKGLRVGPVVKKEMSTPRLREYFPESLLWKPEVITDKNGRAEVNFKMADNITTWKMFAIASDKRGKVGVVEKEITSFQPFFVDLDPPRFLTEGDEIYLPAQVRNYSGRRQRVEVTMDSADWFSFLTPANKQRMDVGADGNSNAIFGFKAVHPTAAGKQRVIAVGQSESDAIEKPVTVRPNGEEIVRTETRSFGPSTRFEVNFPANALPGTQRAELKIYPNLFAHVAESVEGLLQRPYGCGEQTISSTYPNLMMLKFVKEASPLRSRARRFLRNGYERLLGYQVADGGFTYWGGKDTSDLALTAYAVRFLNDANEFIYVDEQVIRRAEAWLISKQGADGGWTKVSRWGSDGTDRTMMTAYVARVFAMGRPEKPADAGVSLAKALAYLRSQSEHINEPYTMSLAALALLDAGDVDAAAALAARLETMAVTDGSGVYWKLNSSTPFYGWGLTGQIETTALVVQVLTRVSAASNSPSDIAARASVYLLKNKDRHGVWHSTQTTINVLDAFLATLKGDGSSAPQSITISVNGVALPDITVQAGHPEQVAVDLAGKLAPTTNTIEIRSSTGSQLMAQVVASHYIDWRDSASPSNPPVRLRYTCDKTNVAIMEEISCTVDAERPGGNGMLLAEIGTPPGADVSRESLNRALESDWSLNRYEVLPDRVVFYLWSKPGGTRFDLKFKPRYGINAKTPASVVYDYYNPEARATVAPLRFTAK